MQFKTKMPSIEVLSATDIPARTHRVLLTEPLREKIKDLTPDLSLFVPWQDEKTGEGYKPTTISQVAGTLTKQSEDYRYSVQSDPKRNGSYIKCILKNDE